MINDSKKNGRKFCVSYCSPAAPAVAKCISPANPLQVRRNHHRTSVVPAALLKCTISDSDSKKTPTLHFRNNNRTVKICRILQWTCRGIVMCFS